LSKDVQAQTSSIVQQFVWVAFTFTGEDLKQMVWSGILIGDFFLHEDGQKILVAGILWPPLQRDYVSREAMQCMPCTE
jgi:hypothetical protein